ncbi:MAG: leucine-rich repeat domain-containing protein [Clostridia bacterium]|nr:leucine-rich repeat domain-containing protein [Clostridia bacterium]
MNTANDFIIKNGVLECYIGHGKRAVVPAGVRQIGKEAFALCRELVSVELPQGVTEIGYQAFWNCENLESVTIPSDVTHIAARAFAYCPKLQHAALPDRLTDVGHELFLGCRSLSHVTLPAAGFAGDKAFKGCEKLADRQGLVIAGSIVYDYCGKKDAVSLPDSVTGLSGEAFKGCKVLRRVTLGHGTKHIGAEAFAQCKNLTEVVLPEGLTHIGAYAFAECDALEVLHLPDGLSEIGVHAFYHCTALERLDVPADVTRIGSGAFARCEKLNIRWSGEGTVERGAFDGVHGVAVPGLPLSYFSTPENKRAAMRGFLQDPECYRHRASWAEYCKYAASQRKKLLPEVFLEDLVPAVAFYGQQKKITSANFDADYLTPAMAAGAYNCMAFLLNWQAERGMPEGFELQLEQELMEDPCSTENMKKQWSFQARPDGTLMLTSYKGTETSIQVPERIGRKMVTALDEYLFAPENRGGTPKPRARREVLQRIVSVQIPEGIVSIGTCAFKDCAGLTEIFLPDSVTEIGDAAFRGCRGLADASGFVIVRDGLYDYCGQERSVTLPKSVRIIGSGAFRGNLRITAVTLPDTIVSVGEEAFRRCKNLKTICMADGITAIGSGAFAECIRLTEVHLPDSVTSLGNAAFGDCENLASVHLPEGLSTLGEYVFSGCTALKSVKIPPGVTIIRAFTFAWCEALRRADIPPSVEDILYGAFVDCDHLQIYGAAGSYAASYARERNLPFRETEDATKTEG